MTLSKRLLLALAILAGPVLAKDPGQALDAFHRAAAEADLDGYFSLMTDEVVFLGTDGSERWQGQAFRDFVRPHFEAGRGWTYTVTDRALTLDSSGRIAWFDEALDNEQLGACRGSGVLVLQDERWKVAQYNLSVPVPNDLVLSVVAQIRGEPAAAAVAVEPAAADEAAPVAETAVQDEAQPEASEEKRCRKRHKTNRAANC